VFGSGEKQIPPSARCARIRAGCRARTRDDKRTGGALIEVCVALVLLATAGTGLVTLLGQTAHSIRTTSESERDVRSASTELDRLTLMDRATLMTRLGSLTTHGWTIDIRAVDSTLFDASISPAGSSAVLLSTTLYRPAGATP
jgi:Tfp pilus assembly protein PilV